MPREDRHDWYALRSAMDRRNIDKIRELVAKKNELGPHEFTHALLHYAQIENYDDPELLDILMNHGRIFFSSDICQSFLSVLFLKNKPLSFQQMLAYQDLSFLNSWSSDYIEKMSKQPEHSKQAFFIPYLKTCVQMMLERPNDIQYIDIQNMELSHWAAKSDKIFELLTEILLSIKDINDPSLKKIQAITQNNKHPLYRIFEKYQTPISKRGSIGMFVAVKPTTHITRLWEAIEAHKKELTAASSIKPKPYTP